MTTRCFPRLYADDRGIWVEDMSGHASGTEWDEVADVAGYKEEGIPRGEDACVRILLGLESGHEIPLRGGTPGFAEVVEAISKQLAGMPIGWFAQIERLQPKDAPVTVWCRSEATPPQGYPRVLADDRGVWKENGPGRRFVTAWDKIDGLVGEGGTASNGEVCTCIELELTDKDLPVDLHPDWPGFAQVIEAMTDRLPGLAAGWFAEAERLVRLAAAQLGGLAATAPIWSRAGPEGYPRLYADDEGVWQEDRPGRRFGYEWHEIDEVGCQFWERAQGQTLVSVHLEGENGRLDLRQDLDEFVDAPSPEMIAAITTRLGMPEGWFAWAKGMKPTRGPLTAWRRLDPAFQLRADDRGVRRGSKLVAEWPNILGVAAHRWHQLNRAEGTLGIELDVMNASRETLSDLEPGFSAVAEAITARLPGIPAEWLAAAKRWQKGQAMTVWRRPNPDGYPRVNADDRGVWREGAAGKAFGIEWDAIDRVVARRKEGAPGQLEVELAPPDGSQSLFLQANWEGYAAVVEAIAARLPHMPTEWPTKLEQLQPGFSIWRRGYIGTERSRPDGGLIMAWSRIENHDAAG